MASGDPRRISVLLQALEVGPNFRSVLASDRNAERAWYNFRNDRATAAIEAWLKKLGLR